MGNPALGRDLTLLVTALALALAAGCSPRPPVVLRLGINTWPAYEFLYLAQEKGFFRAEGLEVRLVEFSSLGSARRAYERGQIDALATTVIEVLQIRDHGPLSPRIVQVIDYSAGADVILARPGITSCAELRGARVGLEFASLGVYVLARALESCGLSLADVAPVSCDQVPMEDALRKGDVDAVVTYPPISTRLRRAGQANLLFSSAEIPGEVLDVIAVEAGFVDRHPAAVAKLLRAYRRAVAYAAQEPGAAYPIMADCEGLTTEEFRAVLTEGIRLVPEAEEAEYLRPGGKLAAVIDASDRILRQNGQIKGPDRRAGMVAPAFAGKGGMP